MKYSLSALFLFVCTLSIAQGSLLLVGGGSEDYNSWSDAPYSWAVQEADSGRVAIIAFGTATQWLPDYFESLGASEANNFNLSDSASINQPHLLDTLLGYDLIFFKGGDQWDYMSNYPGTAVQWAVDSIYSQGGVIAGTSAGMAILSDWVFTAENGTLYPDEALLDTAEVKMTLDQGMWSFYSDYLFDTHFIERGRIGRLIGFSGKLNSLQQNTWCMGLDDRTAIGIDPSGTGELFGAGTATFLPPQHVKKEPWSNPDGYWTSNLPLTVLKKGQQWDFNNHTLVQGNTQWLNPRWGESYMGHTFLIGDHSWQASKTALVEVQQFYWGMPFMVISSDTARAQLFKDSLIANGSQAEILLINAANGDLPIHTQDQYIDLWIGVEHDALMDFFAGTDGGPELQSRYTLTGMWEWMPACAFLGSDVRWFGSTFVDELTTDPYNAYYGDLELKEGLSLLPNSVFIPNTWDPTDDDYYENTVSALPYAMVHDSLTHGFWLNQGSFVEYLADFVVRDSLPAGGAHGLIWNYPGSEFPFLHLHNPGSNTDLLTETHGNGYVRQNGSYDQFLLTFGIETIVAFGDGSLSERNALGFTLYPNPANTYIKSSVSELGRYTIRNIAGQVIQQGAIEGTSEVSVSGLPAGYYLLQIESNSGKVGVQPFIKQ